MGHRDIRVAQNSAWATPKGQTVAASVMRRHPATWQTVGGYGSDDAQ